MVSRLKQETRDEVGIDILGRAVKGDKGGGVAEDSRTCKVQSQIETEAGKKGCKGQVGKGEESESVAADVGVLEEEEGEEKGESD